MNNLKLNIANPKLDKSRDRFIGRFDLLVIKFGVGVTRNV